MITEVKLRATATVNEIKNNEVKEPSENIAAKRIINEPGKYNPIYTNPSKTEVKNNPTNPKFKNNFSRNVKISGSEGII